MLAAVLFVGSAALAQQGLVVDPWHKAVAPVAAPLPPLRALPASGLSPQRSAAPIPLHHAEAPPTQAPKAVAKWSPPVVELLVDPWVKVGATAAPKSRWLAPTPEIIDPWANDAPTEQPRVASRPAELVHSAIF